MKRNFILLMSLLLINYYGLTGNASVTENNPSPGDSINVLSTPDLYSLTTKWANEYNKLYPETKINVISVSETRIAADLIKGGNIGFVSNENYSGIKSETLLKVVVGRDVIVPVINSKNPYLDEISQHGVSPEALVQFLNDPDSKRWGTLLKNNQNSEVHYYRINDASITSGLADFLGTDKLKIEGIEVEDGEKLISAVQNDPYAIGFCKMVNILDFKTQSIAEKIKLLPIDRNGNGIIDYNEKIYDDFNVFSRGVWIGKYPKALFSSIFSVSSNQPGNKTLTAFLKWVLTDGQQFLYSSGYSDLLVSERQTNVDKLYNANIYSTATINDKSLLKTMLFIITAIILTSLIANTVARNRKRKKEAVKTASFISNPVLVEDSLILPSGVYFDKTHTWAFMEQNGVVKVGIDDFLQHITGTITRIKMKNQGEKVKKGEQIVSIIQNGKQLNLYAPISGIIREQNKILDTNSSIINTSPYNEGWIYKIEPTNWLRENQLLFMADKQKRFIKKEFSRLKDFLAATLKEGTGNYAQIVLQDGGELRDNTLSNLGPEVWEDFQTNFIDPSRQIWFYEMF